MNAEPRKMRALPRMLCPFCNVEMASDTFRPNMRGGAPTAHMYDACLRRCATCRVGYSNRASDDPAELTLISAYPPDNVPEEVRRGVCRAIWLALNVRNRPTKWRRFGFSTSEDALTWTVFSWLQQTGALRRALPGIVAPSGREPELMLWGTPVPGDGDGRAWQLRAEFGRLSDELKEERISRSEPDVILDFPERLVFIEVKYRRGGNVDKKATPRKFAKYNGGAGVFTDFEKARTSGCYELVRNWRFGASLAAATKKPFSLLNLGLPRLFQGVSEERTRCFESALNQRGGNSFHTLVWPDFVRAIPERPHWLEEYLRTKGLQLD
jgi:hypothetical protein